MRHSGIRASSGPSNKSSTGALALAAHARVSIGSVFTPDQWCVWLLERFGILEHWLNGATILDPTAGDGQFLRSLIRLGIASGVPPEELPLHSLFAVEREQEYLVEFHRALGSEFGIDLPNSNIICADILLDQPPVKAHILLGNPPWQNFTELPPVYKERVKPLFLRYGLADDRRKLLLGGSRIDIAALILTKTMTENLHPHGNAYFYLPLSLFMNDGANAGFRRLLGTPLRWALKSLHDFDQIDAFPGIATRYGAAHFVRDTAQEFPLPYYRSSGNRWEQHWTSPLHHPYQSFVVFDKPSGLEQLLSGTVRLGTANRPRQGVNTCGANDLLLFSDCSQVSGDVVEVTSRAFGRVRLPAEYLYPLMTRSDFSAPGLPPSRFVLLAYNPSTGKPLSWSEIESDNLLRLFLLRVRERLQQRKGKLCRSWIDRGFWWALLGVGKYCFTPYKVAWLAYGRSEFTPVIFSAIDGRPWQGNQALQAFIPCETIEEAERVRFELSKPEVFRLLRANAMPGTRSWAQPGRIASIIAALSDPSA